MPDVLELFDGVKNVEFEGVKYFEEVGADLPVFTLTDIPAERWNAMAEKSNTEAFIKEFSRQPKNYEEVLVWVYSLIPNEYTPEKYKSPIAANDRAFK